jgi:hypothetical protein
MSRRAFYASRIRGDTLLQADRTVKAHLSILKGKWSTERARRNIVCSDIADSYDTVGWLGTGSTAVKHLTADLLNPVSLQPSSPCVRGWEDDCG